MLPLRNKRNALEYAQRLVQSSIEALLEAEFRQFMAWEKDAGRKVSRNGYNTKTVTGRYGEVTIRIPRDRQGYYSPRLLRKWQRNTGYLDNRIHQIYRIIFSADIFNTDWRDPGQSRFAHLLSEVHNLYAGALSRDELYEIIRCLRRVAFEHRDALENVTYEQVFSLDSMNYVDNTRWFGGYSLDENDRYHFRPYPKPVPKYTGAWGQGLGRIVATIESLRVRQASRSDTGRSAPPKGGQTFDCEQIPATPASPAETLDLTRALTSIPEIAVSNPGLSRENQVESFQKWAKTIIIAQFWKSHAGFIGISLPAIASPPAICHKPGPVAA